MSDLERLKQAKVVAVVRAPSAESLVPLTEALLAGGIEAVEVTTSTPDVLRALAWVREAFGERVLLGVGTVLDPWMVADAVAAGARYVVSPVYLPQVVAAAKASGALACPGCFTPTEAYEAHRAGADVVKIFPAGPLGPGYLKDLLAPMPFLRLMPTGGVEAENVGEWLRAGAFAVGAGSSLVPKRAVADGDWAEITARARTFRAASELAP